LGLFEEIWTFPCKRISDIRQPCTQQTLKLKNFARHLINPTPQNLHKCDTVKPELATTSEKRLQGCNDNHFEVSFGTFIALMASEQRPPSTTAIIFESNYSICLKPKILRNTQILLQVWPIKKNLR
jgi:hypothetical protein